MSYFYVCITDTENNDPDFAETKWYKIKNGLNHFGEDIKGVVDSLLDLTQMDISIDYMITDKQPDDGEIEFKTLKRLKDEYFCDPLELDGEDE